MKSVEKLDIKKLCNFYASDVHLSVMLLPYISKEIDNDVEITTIFEKTQKEEFEKIIEKLNLKNKEIILKINWIENCTEEKIENKLKGIYKYGKKNVIIIGGSETYILFINNIISNLYNKQKEIGCEPKIKIIDCYNIEEIESNMKDIANKYDGIINTINCFEKV